MVINAVLRMNERRYAKGIMDQHTIRVTMGMRVGGGVGVGEDRVSRDGKGLRS